MQQHSDGVAEQPASAKTARQLGASCPTLQPCPKQGMYAHKSHTHLDLRHKLRQAHCDAAAAGGAKGVQRRLLQPLLLHHILQNAWQALQAGQCRRGKEAPVCAGPRRCRRGRAGPGLVRRAVGGQWHMMAERLRCCILTRTPTPNLPTRYRTFRSSDLLGARFCQHLSPSRLYELTATTA